MIRGSVAGCPYGSAAGCPYDAAKSAECLVIWVGQPSHTIYMTVLITFARVC